VIGFLDATEDGIVPARGSGGGGDIETTTAADRAYSSFLLGITVAKGLNPFQRKDGDHQV
jgi:hypothetical protein